jgi:integrase
MESLLTQAPATQLTTERKRLPKATAYSEATGLRSWKLQRGITIRERLNGSGSVSFRLEIPAKVAGTRRIAQFKVFDDAEREAEKALANKEQFGRSGFLLSKAQMDDALRAVGLLSEFNVTLTQAAEYYTKYAKPERGDVTLNKVAELFLEDKRKGTAAKRGLPLRQRSLDDLDSRVGMFTAEHGEKLIKALREDVLRAWLFGREVSAQTRMNHFRCLRNLFNYAVQRGYIAESPLKGIAIGVEEHAPKILTIEQCAALLTTAFTRRDLDLLPFVALGLFCGIRSGELVRLDWQHINLSTGLVTIPAALAKKRRIRNFTMPDACKAWLLAWGTKAKGAIRPGDFGHRFKYLTQAAGIDPWPVNCMRHSAASYHYQRFGDAAKTCAMLGQRSDEVMFTHYRSLVTPEDAERFYKLVPDTSGKVVALPAPEPAAVAVTLPEGEQPLAVNGSQ